MKTNFDFVVDNNKLIISYTKDRKPMLCQAFMYQVTIIEINSTSIESVIINR